MTTLFDETNEKNDPSYNALFDERNIDYKNYVDENYTPGVESPLLSNSLK